VTKTVFGMESVSTNTKIPSVSGRLEIRAQDSIDG